MTKEENEKQIRSAIEIIRAIAEVIREVGEVPSGELYARLMGALDIESYQRAIRALEGAGLVKERSHLLTWVGPAKETN